MILKINDRIRNRKVDYFSQFEMDLKYDSMASTFSFSFLYNPNNVEHRELSCIGHYHTCTIEHNDQLLVTGYVLSQGFTDAPQKQLAAFGGYSLPGFLEDCEIPPTVYPLQSDKLSLREIASKVISPFGVKMYVDPSVSTEMDSVYDVTKAKPSQSVKDFLSGLASQKDIIITHDNLGRLVFTKAKTKQKPILHFGEGGIPATKMSLSFDGQGMHSHITVMKEADIDGGNAGEFTIENPYVPFVYRPRVIQQSSGDDNDSSKVARNALSAELKGLRLVIETDRWDLNGDIIRPNSIITVQNPEIYLFKRRTSWFIESVKYSGDNKALTATLTCVVPEVYNTDTPQYIFSGINLH